MKDDSGNNPVRDSPEDIPHFGGKGERRTKLDCGCSLAIGVELRCEGVARIRREKQDQRWELMSRVSICSE